jgi:hypothetical protein
MKLWMRWETSTQLLNVADGGSKTTMDRLFSNSALLIPAELHEAALREGFRPERRTAIYLIYDVIMQKCARMKGKWAYIPDQSFLKVVKNHTRKSAEKKWLEEKGFIQVKKWQAEDGTLKNSKIPGKKCQAYKLIEQKCECIWADLWERQVVWTTHTENDRFCQYTRSVLDRIQVDDSLAASMCLGKAMYSALPVARRMVILHWARTLQFGCGSIRRGRRVNRLYSPWTSTPRELRGACSLNGEPLVSIDLQASQPTLIGFLAKDDLFCQACLNDELYSQIGKLFGVDRETAKPIFLSYIYGRNRKPTARNARAFQVQQFVADNFPETYAFIWQNKAIDHRAFACRLQNLEAELFLDGIFLEMMQRRLPALTLHDAITVPASNLDDALHICRATLADKLAGKARLKVNGSHGETVVAI